jgi:hypothetical protein
MRVCFASFSSQVDATVHVFISVQVHATVQVSISLHVHTVSQVVISLHVLVCASLGEETETVKDAPELELQDQKYSLAFSNVI